jgi:hypothetical protein
MDTERTEVRQPDEGNVAPEGALGAALGEPTAAHVRLPEEGDPIPVGELTVDVAPKQAEDQVAAVLRSLRGCGGHDRPHRWRAKAYAPGLGTIECRICKQVGLVEVNDKAQFEAVSEKLQRA